MACRELPCDKVIISASHNKEKTRAKADRKIRKKAKKDMKRGSACVSYNFRRAEGTDIDHDNKFLMPLVGHIPVVAFQVVYAAMQGLNTAVVGSEEVGRVVEAIQNSTSIPYENSRKIIFMPEGEQLSLGNSIAAGVAGLPLGEDDPFLFIAADIPFAFDYVDLLNDSDWVVYDVIMNLNSRQAIFPDGKEFIPRNYYHAITMRNGEVHEWKEPNMWQFSMPAMKNILHTTEVAYGSRQNGGVGLGAILRMCAGGLWRNRRDLAKEEKKGVRKLVSAWVNQKLGGDAKTAGSESLADKLLTYAFDVPGKMKPAHSDPWRMKDIDARHDLWFYMLCIKHTMNKYGADNFGELININPYASVLWDLEPLMQEVGQEVPLIGNFPEIENQRADTLGMDRPFDDQGNLRMLPAPGEDIYGAVDDLEKRTSDYMQKTA